MTKWILHRHLKIHTSKDIKDGQVVKQKIRKKERDACVMEQGMSNLLNGNVPFENSSVYLNQPMFPRKSTMLNPTSFKNSITSTAATPIHIPPFKRTAGSSNVSGNISNDGYESKRANPLNYSCNQCSQVFNRKDELAFHLLEHNSFKQNKNGSYLKKYMDEEHDLSTYAVYDAVDPAFFEAENKNKSVNQKSKGSLTTIVSKLHHKVDEKQKIEGEDIIEVQVLENSQESYLTLNLKDSGDNKLGLSNDFSMDAVQRQPISKDFSMDAVQRQPMSKGSDPFISGIVETEQENINNSVTEHGNVVCVRNSDDSSPQRNFEKHFESECRCVSDSFRKQIEKQSGQIDLLQRDLHDYNMKHEKEILNLNTKIDSLTHLISSQSLILNRILLGGKMNVNGTLDFCVQQNSSD